MKKFDLLPILFQSIPIANGIGKKRHLIDRHLRDPMSIFGRVPYKCMEGEGKIIYICKCS